MRGKAVASRLLIGSDVPIICRNERAEGLEIVSVLALVNRRPRQEMYGRRSMVSVGFLGWQRCGLRWLLGKVASSGGGLTTNTRLASCDGSSVRLRLFFAGTMYWGSALTKPVHTKPSKHSGCQATCGEYWPMIATFVPSRSHHQYRNTAAYAKDFFMEERHRGSGRNNPIFCV